MDVGSAGRHGLRTPYYLQRIHHRLKMPFSSASSGRLRHRLVSYLVFMPYIIYGVKCNFIVVLKKLTKAVFILSLSVYTLAASGRLRHIFVSSLRHIMIM